MEEISHSVKKWLRDTKLDLKGAPKKKMPKTIHPMLATLVEAPFDRKGWLYEVKWDGYRIIARVEDGKVTLTSRNGKDYTKIFAPVADELTSLRTDCMLDGEMVILDKDGKPNFGLLQNYQKTGEGHLAYMVFDALYADGHDLRELPLRQRKEVVENLIAPLDLSHYSDHVEEFGTPFFKAAEAKQLEGIMAKDGEGEYVEGKRTKLWLKIKTHKRQEFVIGGYTEPRGSRKGLGSLVVGVYEGEKLVYSGQVGGGFSDKTLKDTHDRLKKLERKTSPFSEKFKTNEKVHWVKPELLAEVSFAEWTSDNQLRQPIFHGLRTDKDPKSAKRESSLRQEETPQAKPQTPNTKIPNPSNVEITHRDKVFFPKDKFTKGDVVDYYDKIAPYILPYLEERPESLNRHPNGIKGESFYQKDMPKAPPWIETVPIHSDSGDKDIHFLICDNKDTLLYMANLGSIEIHPWHSRLAALDNPDWCLIDLDAKTATFENIVHVAQELHKLLDELGVPSVAKTSGKTGIHVCIPLGAKYNYDQSKQFAQLIVTILNHRLPDITSIERNPDKRKKKVYLDFLQNRRGQTMAAPYCIRPVDGAPVSTPLKWSEVKKGLDPKKFNIKSIHTRLKKVGDLWAPVLGKGIDMANVLEKIQAEAADLNQ